MPHNNTNHIGTLEHKTFTLTKWQTILAVALLIAGGGAGYVGGWFSMPERVKTLEVDSKETHDTVLKLSVSFDDFRKEQKNFNDNVTDHTVRTK